MILAVRSKSSKAPEKNYSVAACDGCEAECPGSRQPGQTGNKGLDAACKAAKATPGWTEMLTPVRSGRKRSAWTVELLCPKCSALTEGKVTITDDDGEAD